MAQPENSNFSLIESNKLHDIASAVRESRLLMKMHVGLSRAATRTVHSSCCFHHSCWLSCRCWRVILDNVIPLDAMDWHCKTQHQTHASFEWLPWPSSAGLTENLRDSVQEAARKEQNNSQRVRCKNTQPVKGSNNLRQGWCQIACCSPCLRFHCKTVIQQTDVVHGRLHAHMQYRAT